MNPRIYRLVIRPEAVAEVAEATGWYAQRERGLGLDFLRAFRAAAEVLRRSPLQYQTVAAEARRVVLRRFPYSVFFEVHGSEVVVLACFHESRDPAAWRERLTRP
ncbi:MAG TPA: type II toxin-antitoxin system RelE/ParE family toxin [Longimicrobium sp.]